MRRRSKPYDPERLDRFLASVPKRLSDTAKKHRILSGTRKQSRKWLAEHLEAQHNRCAYCACHLKPDEATLDHIVALAREGLHDKTNTCAACKPCNSLKADMAIEDFLPLLAAKKAAEREATAAYWRTRNAADRAGQER